MNSFTEEYIYSETRPPALMKLNEKNDHIQRANIEQILDAEGEPTNQWKCLSRIINAAETAEVISEMANTFCDDIHVGVENANSSISEVQNISTKMNDDQEDVMGGLADVFIDNEQIKSDQIDVMEALADIYTILAGGAE